MDSKVSKRHEVDFMQRVSVGQDCLALLLLFFIQCVVVHQFVYYFVCFVQLPRLNQLDPFGNQYLPLNLIRENLGQITEN